jgi:ABC-type polysaccharide/polyol phosphate transport system ATPase subunit
VNVIEVRGLAKSFRIPSVRRDTVREHLFGLFRPRRFERLPVLESVSFDVRRGETLGIMGRNGSGKSTLLKLLCGIYRPERGAVHLLAPVTPILELGIGWNAELNAVDNVLLLGTAMGLSLAESRDAVDEVLAFAELERFASLELKHFSSGMAARLAYAVAFKAVREVLVLDEVFTVGDAGFRRRCEDRYRELASQGCTVVLVSHETSPVESFCSRALLLEGGKIALEGSGREIVQAYLELLTPDRPGAEAEGNPVAPGPQPT